MKDYVLQVGDVVKMNPFEFNEHGKPKLSAIPFKDESIIYEVNEHGSGRVKRSNWWKRRNLFVKGVDYT